MKKKCMAMLLSVALTLTSAAGGALAVSGADFTSESSVTIKSEALADDADASGSSETASTNAEEGAIDAAEMSDGAEDLTDNPKVSESSENTGGGYC